ncbi:uncharacterized protein ACLA_063830 [Aspergillus clavatus NRRL 1]|uniref:Uncharacterized protein n=1 Tax=Aspergillus clavatus (strain ATCC 1007 / CBS 513.65 / DSM 816 / NCTC 3887 / NRRL 1 / QM 1276 / 107) TaxID=344612 RepID=A1CD06_ASPCL|nr:uncharacterized protein ACLA_063830 [Aspergillus clavatus NRRL 1]EAW12413.1 conserved hypothetical protein [Aspergillus clavatus NRRL 1]
MCHPLSTCLVFNWIISISPGFDRDTEIVAVSKYADGTDDIGLLFLAVSLKDTPEEAEAALAPGQQSRPADAIEEWFCREDMLEEAFTTLPHRKACALLYAMNPCSRRTLPDMALSTHSDHYFALYTMWKEEKDNARCQAWVRSVMQQVQRHSVAAYLGDSDFQECSTRYWSGRNGCRLIEVRRKFLFKEIRPGSQALASILVSVSPNLERLTLCPVGQELPKQVIASDLEAGREINTPDYFFKHFLERSTGNRDRPFLQNLKTVRFIPDPDNDSGGYMDLYYQEYDLYGSLNLVRRLPAIDSVRLDAITDPEESSVRPPSRSANYTKIVIRNSSIDYHYLTDAIDSAKRLKEFTFSVGGHASIDGSFRLFYPDAVFGSLLLHRNTLEHLDLDVDGEIPLRESFDPSLGQYFFADDDPGRNEEEYQFEWEEEPEELRKVEQKSAEKGDSPSSCSLRSFVQLKHLSLGIHLLYYFARGICAEQLADGAFSVVDQLPPSLESLCIYGYIKGMKPPLDELPADLFDTEMAKLMAEKDQKLPLLRVIEGIDTTIENAKTIDNLNEQENEVWERESDCEWTDYEY